MFMRQKSLTEVELSEFNAQLSPQHSTAALVKSRPPDEDETSARGPISELPPVDGGKDALLFLLGATICGEPCAFGLSERRELTMVSRSQKLSCGDFPFRWEFYIITGPQFCFPPRLQDTTSWL